MMQGCGNHPVLDRRIMKVTKSDIFMFVGQVVVWTVIISLPALTAYLSTYNIGTATTAFKMIGNMLMSPLLLYFINYYVLWKFFFDKKRYVLFVLANILLIFATNTGIFFYRQYAAVNGIEIPIEGWIYWGVGIFVYLLFIMAVIVVATAQRHLEKTRKIKKLLEEEKQKSTEAELAWLKSQINPHFLFNTLNNISSLTQIDADKAQDSIAQLSDLLRYAMYETNKPMVPISGEVEFMRNYIELMRLRCNERTTVVSEFSFDNPDVKVAPLLFISLIENAFKHGVSSNKPSSIDIRMNESGGAITFCCDNTNYPKNDSDRSGSGIGLENTRRRLELLYAGKYEWEQSIVDNIYHVSVKINDGDGKVIG